MATCSDHAPAGLLTGIQQFNAREFYECHETLEAIWLAEPGQIRTLYQGILQVGVAFYHLGRQNVRGATSLFETGIAYLQPFAPHCMGVNVQQLIDESIRCYTELLSLGRECMSDFDQSLIPTIQMV
ncbi:MAG TPA: DUF309 domain-containing protein [Chloroflexota bacterium]|nr:DUF309 domain-containing protein [Chloroflexota bacterium]